MTSETRTLVGIDDILAIEFECRHCAARVSYPIDKMETARFVRECPNCHDGWFIPTPENQTTQNFDALQKCAGYLKSLQTIKTPRTKMSFVVRLNNSDAKS